MKKNILSLFLFVLIIYSDSVSSIESDIDASYFDKNFSFSEPKLNVKRLGIGLVQGKLSWEIYIDTLVEAAEKGNVDAIEKLYMHYTKPFLKYSAINSEAAERLLEKAIESKCAWVFWEKAKKEQVDKDGLNEWYYKAVQLDHKDAVLYVEEKINHQVNSELQIYFSKPNAQIKKNKKTLIKFINKWKKIGYGYPIYLVCQLLIHKNLGSIINIENALYDAAILGYSSASQLLAESYSESITPEMDYYLQEILLNQNIAPNPEEIECHMGGLIIGGHYQHPGGRVKALEHFKKAADKGSASAMSCVGDILSEDKEGVRMDRKSALAYYLEAFKKGNMNSCIQLGSMYMKGFDGQVPDRIKAYNYFSIAEARGFKQALIGLGILIEDGFIVDEEYKKLILDKLKKIAEERDSGLAYDAAYLVYRILSKYPDSENDFEVFKYALNSGEYKSDAMYFVGCVYLKGSYGQKINQEEGIKWLDKSAKLDNADANALLSSLYNEFCQDECMQSEECCQNKKKELEYIFRAADLGERDSQYNAGLYCSKGVGNLLPIDTKRAVQYYEEAAKQGCTGSQYNLSVMLYHSKDFNCFPENIDKALFYARKAAEESTISMNFAGQILVKEGNVRDKEEMIREGYDWLKKSADSGEALALHNLGVLIQGEKIKLPSLTIEDAIEYYKKAAHKGFLPSMHALASYYLMFDDNESFKAALFWYRKARSMGDQNSSKYLIIAEEKKFNELDVFEPQDTTDPDKEEETISQIIEESKNYKGFDSISEIKIIKNNHLNNSKIIKNTTNIQDEESSSSDDDEEQIQELEQFTSEAKKVDVTQISNPKYIRSQLKKMGELAKRVDNPSKSEFVPELSKANKDRVRLIQAKESKNIKPEDIKTLFKDPFFGEHVSVVETKCGFSIIARSANGEAYEAAGTHRKHNKSYKGVDRNFVKNLIPILELFGL